MYSERILQLLAKQMGNAASGKELLELEELLRKYPEYHFLVEILQSLEGEKVHKEPAMSEEALVHEGWGLLQDELNHLQANTVPLKNSENSIRIIPSLSWLRSAAIWAGVILLAGSAFFVWKTSKGKKSGPLVAKTNQLSVPFGTPEKKILPDSTVVWLNAGSRIRYAENFIQNKREVYLEGEAFFSVAHDAEHPFIVHAGNIAVRALGTQFNVQAYPDENRIETTLISGKVQVTMDEKPDQRIILDPNEKLTVTNEGLKLSETNARKRKDISFQVQEVVQLPSITSVSEVAWLQDKLAFQNEAFKELAKKMERRYAKRIVFEDSSLGNERLNGVFENETIEKALTILQMTTPFHYRVYGHTVYLDRD
jgi:ferric-dicitrate binding protein FerR (iron transport regulator)